MLIIGKYALAYAIACLL